MVQNIDFQALYQVQDTVLNALKLVDTDFYLTGGTCLHRFFFPRRFSEDLDFFCSETPLFHEQLRRALLALRDEGIVYEQSITARDFTRIMVDGQLKVDFVHDRVYRQGYTQLSSEGYKIDNLDNRANCIM